MKIFDLECNGCRRKYTFTFTMQSMQWPDVIAGIAAFKNPEFCCGMVSYWKFEELPKEECFVIEIIEKVRIQ